MYSCHIVLFLFGLQRSKPYLVQQPADLLGDLAKNEVCILQHFEIQILEKIPK